MIRILILSFLVPPLLFGQDDPLAQRIGQTKIRHLQKELGSPSWNRRQRSMNRLIKLGNESLKTLRELESDHDSEIRHRARHAIRVIKSQKDLDRGLEYLLAEKFPQALLFLSRALSHGDCTYYGHIPLLLEEFESFSGDWNQFPKNSNPFQMGVFFHNLYLILKASRIDHPPFAHQASRLYRSCRTDNHRRALILEACCLAEIGQREEADRLYHKGLLLPVTGHQDDLDLAYYFSILGEHARAIHFLKTALQAGGENARYWITRSCDYFRLWALPAYQDLISPHKTGNSHR